MEKNYYEILEVNENASPEIIEKAYKTLVKKYHPDLQNDEQKNLCEQKLKTINEAYEILSDKEKRKNYDIHLQKIQNKELKDLYNENEHLKTELDNLKNTKNNSIYNNLENQNISKNATNIDFQNTLHNNYKNNVNNNNQIYYDNNSFQYQPQIDKKTYYKYIIKSKIRSFITSLIAIIVIIVIFYILWHIPAIKSYCINLYNENFIINTFVNFIIKLFTFS